MKCHICKVKTYALLKIEYMHVVHLSETMKKEKLCGSCIKKLDRQGLILWLNPNGIWKALLGYTTSKKVKK